MLKTNTFRHLFVVGAVLASTLFAGCASVPMASQAEDAAAKAFKAPADDKAGLYVFRDSNFGGAVKKIVSLDGMPLFQSAPKTYFYTEVLPGKHTLSTESEFGDNALDFVAEGGKLQFFRNYIKMGVFVGGANLEAVSEEEGKKGVQESGLAAPLVKKQ